MPVSNPTPLDVAASIDRVLRRNIQWPNNAKVFADSPVALTVLDRATMCNAVGGAMVVTLPDATLNKGMDFIIKKTDASGNTVTIQPAVGGQTIDGAGSKILNATNDFIVVESDGANYKVIGIVITPAGGGGAVFYTVKKIYKTDGVAGLNPVPGTQINFNVAVDGECFFSATGVFAGLSGLISADLAIYVDGTLLAHSDYFAINGSGGDRTGPVTQEPSGSRFLSAGPHTCELRAGQVNISLQASPADPLTLSVLYPAASFTTAAPTPKAATFVVHPVPGVGDFTTIQAALNAIIPIGGGMILVREGTYPLNLENVVGDVAVEIVGCGSGFNDNQATVLDLGANGINAFRRTSLKHLRIAHMRVRGNGVAASAFLKADAPDASNFVDVEDVVVDNLQKCFVTDAGPATLLVRALQLYFTSAVAGPKFWDGGPGQIEAYNCEAANGSVSGPMDVTGSDFIMLLDDGPVNDIGAMILSDSVLAGEYKLTTGRQLLLSSCAFVLGFGPAPNRFLDIPAGILPSAISGVRFDAAAVEEIRNAGSKVVVEAVTGGAEPRVTETGAADENSYRRISLASTILGAKTLVNDENVQTVAVDTTLDVSQRTVNVNANAAPRTITLPPAARAKYRKYTIKKIDASANAVTIDGDGAETIDGAATQSLPAQYDKMTVQSDGTQWWIV